MVSFHAMMTTFIAASVIPAFGLFAEEFEVDIQTASYIAACQVSNNTSIVPINRNLL
jgi:hypothetical protein